MPLPSSGNTISLNQVNVELGIGGTANITMNNTSVRTLFGKPGSGNIIAMSDGWGKSGIVPVNIGAITYSQSSIWPGTTPVSNAIMTDKSFTNTGAATDNGNPSFIKMDLGAAYTIDRIIVGTATGNIPGGWDSGYTQKRLEYSSNDSSWTLLQNIQGYGEGIFTFNVYIFNVRYIRLSATFLDGGNLGYVAMSEFYALAPGQSY